MECYVVKQQRIRVSFFKVTSCTCLLLLLLANFFSSSLFAQTQADIKTDTQNVAADVRKTKLIVHIDAAGKDGPLALGLGLLLSERLLEGYNADVISHSEAVSHKQSHKNNRVQVKDMAYICLKTEADIAVLGWIERNGEQLSLKLHDYNCSMGSNKKAELLSASESNMGQLIKDATEAIASMLDLSMQTSEDPDPPVEDKETTIEVHEKSVTESEALKVDLSQLSKEENFEELEGKPSASGITKLGNGWQALEAGKSQNAIEDMVTASQAGASIPILVVQWMIPVLETKYAKSFDEFEMDLKSKINFLKGDIEPALEALDKTKRSADSNIDAELAIASKLLKQNKLKPAFRLLSELKKIQPDSIGVSELLGLYYLKTNKLKRSRKFFRIAYKNGSRNPRVLIYIAEDLVKKKKSKSAVDVLNSLAEIYNEGGMKEQANYCYIQILAIGGPEETLDKIHIEELSEKEQRDLLAYLSELKGKPTKSRMYFRSRIAQSRGSMDEQEEWLVKAAEASPDDFYMQMQAGLYFLETAKRPLSAIEYLNRAVNIKPDSAEAFAKLAVAYKAAERCDDAIISYQKSIALEPQDLPRIVEYSKILMSCDQVEAAINLLKGALQVNSEYAPAMAMLIRTYSLVGDGEQVKTRLEQLERIEKPLASQLESMPKIRKLLSELERTEDIELADIKVNFPATKSLLEIVPFRARRVLLLDLTLTNEDMVNQLFNAFPLDGRIVHEDFKALMSRFAQVLENSTLIENLVPSPDENPATLKSIRKLADEQQVDAVLLHRLEKDEEGVIQLTLFCYLKDRDEITYKTEAIIWDTEMLERFNPLVLSWPSLLILLALLRQLRRRHMKWGSLKIDFLYDSELENGYFAARLSKRKLKQAFRLDSMMAGVGSSEDQELDKLVRKHLSSRAGLVGIATDDRVTLDLISPGHYYLYIGGLIVSTESKIPIGTHEIQREIDIFPDVTSELEMDLRVKEVYVKVLTFIDESDSDDIQTMLKKKTEQDIVGGANITVNGDPTLERNTTEGTALEYYLPLGEYEFVASYKELKASHRLAINDRLPKVVELSMKEEE